MKYVNLEIESKPTKMKIKDLMMKIELYNSQSTTHSQKMIKKGLITSVKSIRLNQIKKIIRYRSKT